MADVNAWPWFDAELSIKGELAVGPAGEIFIDIGGTRFGGMIPTEAMELAILVLARAKGTHRLIETSALSDAIDSLKELLEP